MREQTFRRRAVQTVRRPKSERSRSGVSRPLQSNPGRRRLRWEDLKSNELHVKRTAWRPTQVVEQTKTEASKAAVPVIPELAKHLEAHRNGSSASGFIFTGAKMGRLLDLHNVANRAVRPALRKAGVEWCGWHGFRRGLSTNLKTLGVDDLVIQRILRHANVGVTRQSYIKIEDRVKTAAMKKLQGSLNAKIKARKARKKSVRRHKNKGTLRTNFRTLRHASLVGR
jgi:Phage integrase family